MELVKEHRGFEFVQAFRDFEDHLLGGKDNIFWFTVMKDCRIREAFIGIFQDGAWKDFHIKGSGRNKKTKEMQSGSTILKIAGDAYLGQDEPWVQSRKPKLVQDGHPHLHYVYGFGDRALDISEQYGVTIGYSNINDLKAGFHLRDLSTGKDVTPPELSV